MSDQIAAYRKDQDAFGHMVFDHYEGKEAIEIIQREDGYTEANYSCETYFSEYDQWPEYKREALKVLLPGRVLDLGCGAGRVELYLQKLGFEVPGIDNSPLAIQVCKLRGVKDARLLSIAQMSQELGTFTNILMLGNNWGLMGNFKRARWLLRKFHGMTAPRARIIAESNNVYQTTSEYHLAYQAYNRERGRMSGQIRMRVLYKMYRSRWFDYLMVSPEEMKSILEGTGWKVMRIIQPPEGSMYAAFLEKE